MTVAALGAALLAAGCTTNADRRAEQYAEAGGQMEYNIGVVKAEQERIQPRNTTPNRLARSRSQKQAAKRRPTRPAPRRTPRPTPPRRQAGQA